MRTNSASTTVSLQQSVLLTKATKMGAEPQKVNPTSIPHKLTNRKPWYNHLTLDLLLSVLSKSIFHPAITLIFYLCLASVHEHRTPLAAYTLYWTAFLALVEITIYANRRITYGWARDVKWENEVVVITGGGSGLGRVLAELLMLGKGVRIAVLDLRGPDEEAVEWIEGRGGFLWEVCDVGDLESVRRAAERVREELGTPTILINNAATPVNGLPLLPALNSGIQTITPEQAARTLQINTVSHFNTLTTFLPLIMSSPHGGHVITISSILSHLAPSQLSDYAASKAALSSLHNTLTHELSVHPSAKVRKSLKTILVEPGMMNTQLFADITTVPWYANFFGPVLDVKDMAQAIVRLLERGESGVIRMPVYCAFMPLYGVMPGSMQKFVRWFAGIDQAIVVEKKTNGIAK